MPNSFPILGVSTAAADDDDGDDGGGHGSGGSDSGRFSDVHRGLGNGRPLFDLLKREQPKRERRPAQRRQTPPPLPTHAPELVVRNLSDTDRDTLLSEGFAIIDTIALTTTESVITRMSAPDGHTLEEARSRIRQLPSGANADLNHFYRTGNAETIREPETGHACEHANCAAHELVSWPNFEMRARTCPVTLPIGVIDTGVNPEHDLLKGAKIEVVDGLSRDEDPSQSIHGTAVISVLSGMAGGRVEGLLPEASLVVADVFARKGKDERADVVALSRGLDEMAGREIQIVNLSLTGPENTVLAELVKQLIEDRKMTIVAAAGNGGPSAKPSYPAGFEGVLAVTAVDRRARVYRAAQRGPHLDIAAPGVGLTLATSVRGAREKTGTSFAAPFVAAAAALVLSREPHLTPAQVAERLAKASKDLGAEGHDEIFGHGLIDASRLCSTASETK